MAKAHLPVIGYASRNAECLKTFADCLCGIGCLCTALLYGYCGSKGVCPACVFKAYRLNSLYNIIWVKAFVKTNLLCLFKVLDTILFQNRSNLVDSSFVTFKQTHFNHSFLGFIFLAASSNLPYWPIAFSIASRGSTPSFIWSSMTPRLMYLYPMISSSSSSPISVM